MFTLSPSAAGRGAGWVKTDMTGGSGLITPAQARPTPCPSACALPGMCLPLHDARSRAPASVHLQPGMSRRLIVNERCYHAAAALTAVAASRPVARGPCAGTQSVAGLISVLESGRPLSGRWYDYKGEEIPW